jgi:beta-barrel assembly-enhancing protease
MKMKVSSPKPVVVLMCAILALVAASVTLIAQTEIQLRKNKYAESDDVQLGRQAAAEMEKKLTIVRDREMSSYLARVGNHLAESIPEQFQHSQFEYTFKVVEAKEINAFALPGGPMYVNTGMIVAAKREGEMAGVMAHEIAHVALRHGTAQATKGEKYQTLGALGQIGGAILGGAAGTAVGQGAQMGAGMYLLKFSREYETEADVLGAQILARAGYDPRDLGEMFKTIEAQGGSGGPQFLSSHPNPQNRYQRIEQEAKMLKVSGQPPDDRDFRRMQARIANGGR